MLSSFDGQTKIITSATTIISFTYVDTADYCGKSCLVNAYKITVSGGPNPGLIFLADSSQPSITFSGSDNTADAGNYTIGV